MIRFLKNTWGILQISFMMIGFYLVYLVLAALFGGGGGGGSKN